MRGRKPLTDLQKFLHGEKRPERMRGELIVEHPAKLPAAPKYLSKTGRKYYNSVGIFLLKANIITPVDVGVLEMCSFEFGKYKDFSEAFAEFPLTDIDDDGRKKLKTIRTLRNEAHEHWLKLAIELGLTPAARLKFHVQREEKSELQTFLDTFND